MTSLRDAFAGLKEAKDSPAPPPAASQAGPSKKTPAKTAPTKTTGKSSISNRDVYTSLKVYVRKETRRKAARKWEDEGGRDLSDLIEHLLSQYAGS